MALGSASLHDGGEHDEQRNLVLPDHIPELKTGVRQGALEHSFIRLGALEYFFNRLEGSGIFFY